MGSTSTKAKARRRIALWVLAAVACLVAGTCALRRWQQGRGLTERSLAHDGMERVYFVHLPPGHSRTKPVPLVVTLHGGGGTARGFESGTGAGVTSEADRRGWVVVFPEGIERGWHDGREEVTARDGKRGAVDDVGFIRALVDRMQADYGIDPKRVYATGISNGGFMCQRLAVELSDRMAAVASVTATLPKVLEPQTPSRAVSVMLVNGTADPLVPYEGGQVQVFGRERGEVMSTDATIAWWAKHGGCTAAPSTRSLPDRAPDDGTTVSRTEISGCRAESAVVLYRVQGGGHTWPGGQQYLPRSVIGIVSRDFDATPEIFDFFSKHER